jgi:hypothetical protein
MRYLRKNTAVIITVGPFYDKTDGVTIETGLTITNERITLVADTDDGNAPTNILDNVTGATSGTANDLNYITNNDAGMMQMELAAADVNRNGRLLLSITDAANHVPVFHEFMILPTVIYDALVLGTDNFDVSVADIANNAITAAAIATGAVDADALADDAIDAGAVKADAVTKIQTGLALEATLTAIKGAGWSTETLAAIDVLIDAIKAKTDNLPTAPADDTSIDTQLATIAGYLDTEVAAILAAVDTEVDAIKAKTDNLPASPAATGAAMTLTSAYDKAKDDVLTPLAIVDGIADGLKTTLDNVHDTDLPAVKTDTAAIKTKTDNLPSDPADESALEALIADLPTNSELATSQAAADDATLAAIANLDGDVADVFDDVGDVQTIVDAILLDTGTTLDDIVDSIKAKTDNLPSDPADESLLEAAIATIGGGGAGTITWVYNLKDNLGANIPDATIWVTSDAAGITILASGLTDTYGNVTFYLDAGTVYVWGQKSGYNFTNPDLETVSE